MTQVYSNENHPATAGRFSFFLNSVRPFPQLTADFILAIVRLQIINKSIAFHGYEKFWLELDFPLLFSFTAVNSAVYKHMKVFEIATPKTVQTLVIR